MPQHHACFSLLSELRLWFVGGQYEALLAPEVQRGAARALTIVKVLLRELDGVPEPVVDSASLFQSIERAAGVCITTFPVAR